MKKIKNIILLAFSVLLVIIALPTLPASAAELRYGKTVISQMNNGEALYYLYNRLEEECKKDKPQNININTSKYKITSKELVTLYHIFLADFPEYFWLDGSCQYANDQNNGYVYLLIPSYSMESSSLKNAKNAFERKVNSLIQGLNGKSEYEKSLILHDRLAETTEYISTSNDQNAYGALVEGKAVCAGYSKAYQHLLHKVGIPAWCVIGTSEDPNTHQLQNHEWNLVSIDNKWYYSDVTWDDQEYLFYAYFNITTEQMKKNHYPDDEFKAYLPKATATDANYFAKNNRVYQSFDLDRLANQLKADNYRTRIYVNGDTNAFKAAISRNVENLLRKMGVPANYGCSYSTVSIGGEIDFDVILIEPDHKHNPTPVAAKSATCTSKGNTAYYTCSCGKWFKDALANNEITDKHSVETPAVAHIASSWKSDNINHWRNCSKCGVEMANSMNHHTDSDLNYKCDTCAYSLPKDQIAAAPTGSTQSTQSNNSNTTSGAATSVPTESTTESETASTEEAVSEEDVANEPQDTTVTEPKPKKKNIVIPIVVAVGSVALISSGVGIFFLLKHN